MRRMLWLLLLAAFAAAPARAWGPEGHILVAEIAERRLDPAVREKVWRLLDGATLASVANWADAYRLLHPETARWHFVDIPKAASGYDPARDCEVEMEGDCLIPAVARAIKVIKEMPDTPVQNHYKRADALKFLVHFIGDVHQPLHAILEFGGGNGIHVKFFGKDSNLHKVWDEDLIMHAGRYAAEYADYLEKTVLAGKDIPALAGGDPIKWAVESHDHAVKAFVPDHAELADDYYKTWGPVVDERLALAGVRLARMLNEIFK